MSVRNYKKLIDNVSFCLIPFSMNHVRSYCTCMPTRMDTDLMQEQAPEGGTKVAPALQERYQEQEARS